MLMLSIETIIIISPPKPIFILTLNKPEIADTFLISTCKRTVFFRVYTPNFIYFKSYLVLKKTSELSKL